MLSLLYQGRKVELEQARPVGGTVFGEGGEASMCTDGLALDGQLPSRKELGEVVRLQFDSAEKVG